LLANDKNPYVVYTLSNNNTSVSVDAIHGCRLSSLRIHDTEVLLTGGLDDTALTWGCYPMVPYAGRVRSGVVRFDNVEHQLPLTLPPHAAHGTVFTQSWNVVDVSASRIELFTDLGPHWPFGGSVSQRIELKDDHVHLELRVTADDQAMPAQVGWHPWFRKPSHASLIFESMLQRDEHGIATSRCVESDAVNVDDCFVNPLAPLSLTVNGVDLVLSSDCSHWVVYDLPPQSTCVEPQSGAPNEINDSPVILAPGESLTKWFTIAWTGRLIH
jgi:aldose 1-epimerase